MARMLAKAMRGHHFAYCFKRCCRGDLFYGHHGRQNPKVRKVQRSREKQEWKKEL